MECVLWFLVLWKFRFGEGYFKEDKNVEFNI